MGNLMATEALWFMGDHRGENLHTLIALRGSVATTLGRVSPAKPSKNILAPRAVRIVNARSKLKHRMNKRSF